MEIYYTDPNGRVHRRNLVYHGETLVSYPANVFDLVDGDLQPKKGYTVLDGVLGLAAYLAQEAADALRMEQIQEQKEQAHRARIQAIKDAFGNGEFGTMTAATFESLFGFNPTA